MADNKGFRFDYYPAVAYADFTNLEGDEIAIVMQVSNLNYLKEGPIENDPAWIARSIKNMTRTRCKNILEKLIAAGEISQTPDGKLFKKRAINELETLKNRREVGSFHGRIGNEIKSAQKKNQQDSNRPPDKNIVASTSTSTSEVPKEKPHSPFLKLDSYEREQYRKGCPSMSEKEFEDTLQKADLMFYADGGKNHVQRLLGILQAAEKKAKASKPKPGTKMTLQDIDELRGIKRDKPI